MHRKSNNTKYAKQKALERSQLQLSQVNSAPSGLSSLSAAAAAAAAIPDENSFLPQSVAVWREHGCCLSTSYDEREMRNTVLSMLQTQAETALRCDMWDQNQVGGKSLLLTRSSPFLSLTPELQDEQLKVLEKWARDHCTLDTGIPEVELKNLHFTTLQFLVSEPGEPQKLIHQDSGKRGTAAHQVSGLLYLTPTKSTLLPTTKRELHEEAYTSQEKRHLLSDISTYKNTDVLPGARCWIRGDTPHATPANEGSSPRIVFYFLFSPFKADVQLQEVSVLPPPQRDDEDDEEKEDEEQPKKKKQKKEEPKSSEDARTKGLPYTCPWRLKKGHKEPTSRPDQRRLAKSAAGMYAQSWRTAHGIEANELYAGLPSRSHNRRVHDALCRIWWCNF